MYISSKQYNIENIHQNDNRKGGKLQSNKNEVYYGFEQRAAQKNKIKIIDWIVKIILYK